MEDKISEKILLEVITCLGNPVFYKYTSEGGRENMRKLARKTMDELIKKGIFEEMIGNESASNYIEILKKKLNSDYFNKDRIVQLVEESRREMKK